ncbi:P-loop containing nucleoside triphosphate hydrolase protein [Mycena pura]|uniref:DNA 3'-5' helicase n=1 Tax=Mycena pura TaxID=153505 RepID=A0AAD6XXF2_9AGAR|nr:P-loop containing nucleoside triphosphate hydrolase protein [Mycena pura]
MIPARHHGKTPKPRRTRLTSKVSPEDLETIREELKLLPSLIKQHFKKWTNGAQPFQLQCMEAQKLRRDVLLLAATGSGKTGIAAGPHLLPSSKGKVTLVVSPLLALHEEQVTTFREEFGLKAIAINSLNGGCTASIMEVSFSGSVVVGESQIVILAPELLLSRQFIDGVLRNSEFGTRCLAVFIDEAHCVSHWGDSFRKKYASIGLVRAFLPRATPFIAVTATLTPRVHQDLLLKLQFDPRAYLFCTIGNDRPTVSQVVRALEHPANSFRDLAFVVEENAEPKNVKKAFVYSDDMKDGSKIVDHLNERFAPAYRSQGRVRPYNAAMSPEYRAHVMRLFKAGIIRVLVCTDAAGMGCDIPDIELVVQWKLPKNLSSWVQRAGRVARARGSTGMAVMLVERTAFEVGTAEVAESTEIGAVRGRGRGHGTRGRGRGGRGRGRGAAPKQGKDYAVSHGQKHVPPADCCDLCNPKLFDHTRPCKPVRATRQKGIRRGPPVDSVRAALFTWRRSMKKMHYPRSVFAPHALLDDATCELLASVGPIESLKMLQQLLEPGWTLWKEFGTRLYVYLHDLAIPPLPPPPARKNKASAAAATAAATSSAPAPSGPSALASTTQEANKRPHSLNEGVLPSLLPSRLPPHLRRPLLAVTHVPLPPRTVPARPCKPGP